jgi:hypothetical protein
MRARLAQLDAVALDVPDAEALADEVVEPDPAHRELAPRPAGREAHVVDDLALDERQRLTGRRALGMEVAVALETLAGGGANGVHGPQRAFPRGAEMDGFDHYRSIISFGVALAVPRRPVVRRWCGTRGRSA